MTHRPALPGPALLAIGRNRQQASGEEAGRGRAEDKHHRPALREILGIGDDVAPAPIAYQLRDMVDLIGRAIGIARDCSTSGSFERLCRAPHGPGDPGNEQDTRSALAVLEVGDGAFEDLVGRPRCQLVQIGDQRLRSRLPE